MSNPKAKKKPNLRSALAASIGAEEKSVSSRFERAEELFGNEKDATKQTRVIEAEKESHKSQKSIVKSPAKKKPKPERVVRDSFTMPPHDYDRIAQIIRSALQDGISLNKSEVIRAGLMALQKMSSKERHALLKELERVKPGRPAQ